MARFSHAARRPLRARDTSRDGFARDLRAVLAEPAPPLAPTLLRFMERGFGADFSDVRLHDSPAARGAVRSRGAHALTLGRDILLGFPAAEITSPSGRLVLAHELAHVVQRRIGAAAAVLPRRADDDAGEFEAAWAAACVCSGGSARCEVPGDPARAAAWGEVGHFFTVYFVMLAVGMPPKKAQRIAFFTQFPDEVEELDALTIGLKYAKGRFMTSLGRANSADSLGVSVADSEVWDSIDASLKDSLHIQRGLHALTGASADSETRRRTAILAEMKAEDADFEFDFGLALHPFGDSFAHRDGGNMFKPPFGHGFHGTAPDTISFGREKLYLAYVNAMYAIGASKRPPGAVRMTQENTAASLRELCVYGSALNSPQSLQAEWIMRMSHSRMGIPMSDYNPLKYDVVPFAVFVGKSYSHLAGVEKRHLDRAIALSRKWA